MTLRIGFVDRFPILYLNNATGMLGGIYGPLIKERIGIITKGLNLTWYIGGKSNRGCLDGSCRAIATFIQSGKADLCSESSQMFLFDAIYPNISLSPPVLELDCRFLSFATKKPTRSFNDILTSLQVFTPSALLFLIALLLILFAFKNLSLWFYYMKRSNPGLAERFNIKPTNDNPKSTAKPDIELPKVSGLIFLLILLQFQTWYSASFQTNLVSLIQSEPVSSLANLLDRDLHAHVATTSNCYRGLFHGKDSATDPRVNKSIIIIRAAEVRQLLNVSFVGQPMVVFLGNNGEIVRIKKTFSRNPTVYNPKEVRIRTTNILDVYMYRDDLQKEKAELLLSRFHSVLSGNLFHDRVKSNIEAEQESDYDSKISAVGFQSLSMANYRYAFTIYTLFIGSITIWFVANQLIQSVVGKRRVSRFLAHSKMSPDCS